MADEPPGTHLGAAARLDALLRLQFEEQNQSRHHDAMRDRAIGNMMLVVAALLAILGALYQARLDDNPTVFQVAQFLLPAIMVGFGIASCFLSLRHSLHADRHWGLARLYRRQAFALMDAETPSRGLERRRALLSARIRHSGKWMARMERWDRRRGLRSTWGMWLLLPALLSFAGLALLVASIVSALIDKEQPPRPSDIRVIVEPDGNSVLRRRPFSTGPTTPNSTAAEMAPPVPAPR